MMAESLRLLTCDKCSAQFVDGRSLDIHLRQIHNDVRPFLCHLCPASFASPVALENHVEICTSALSNQVQPNIKYPPVQTSLKFPPVQTDLKFPPVQTDFKFPPVQTDLKFPAPNEAVSAVPDNSSQAVTFTCSNCSSRFSSATKLKIHALICNANSTPSGVTEQKQTPTVSAPAVVPQTTSDSKTKPITLSVKGPTVANILGNVSTGKVISKEQLDALVNFPGPKFRKGTIRDMLLNQKQQMGSGTKVIKLSAANIANLPASITAPLRAVSLGQKSPQLVSIAPKPLVSASAALSVPASAGSSIVASASSAESTSAGFCASASSTSSTAASASSASTTASSSVDASASSSSSATSSTAATSSLTPDLPPVVEPQPAQASELTPFKCLTGDCDEDVISIKELGVHISDKHPPGDKYTICCVLCDICFGSISELEEHVRSFVCPVDAEGKWKGFGSMPSLPSGSLDIFHPSIVGTMGDVKLPDVSELPGLKFDKPDKKDSQELFDKKPDPSTFILNDSDSGDSEPADPKTLADQRRQQKRHTCNVCQKQYNTLHAFTKHYKKHTIRGVVPQTDKRAQLRDSLGKYACNVCDKTFNSFDQLFSHRKIHTGETPFSCKYCDMAFVKLHGLQHHMYCCHPWALTNLRLIHCRVVKETALGARACPGKFFDIKGLREHFVIVHKNQPGLKAVCDVCHLCFVGPDAMEEHIRSNQCKIGARINEWLSHLDVKPSDTEREDVSLPGGFMVSGVRVRNSRQTEGRPRLLQVQIDRITKCPRCKRQFSDLSVLQTHYNTRCDIQSRVSNEEWRGTGAAHVNCYFCSVCKLRFSRSNHYEQHMELHRITEKSESLEKVEVEIPKAAAKNGKQCSLCFKVFDTMADFFEHYKSHGIPRGSRQRRKRMLEALGDAPIKPEAVENGDNEMNEETPETPSTEPVKKPKLIWHASEKTDNMGSAPEDRTLKLRKVCPVCSKIFTEMDAFINHYRLHYKGDAKAVNASYTCSECGSSFISRQVYLNHLKFHSGETPFKCKFCNEACATEVDLGLHIPAAHMKQKFFKVVECACRGRPVKHHLATSVYELELMLGYTSTGGKRNNWYGKCLECDAKLSSYKEIKIHILSQECAVTFRPLIITASNESMQRFLCKICGNLYEDARGLQAHLVKAHTTSNQNTSSVVNQS